MTYSVLLKSDKSKIIETYSDAPAIPTVGEHVKVCGIIYEVCSVLHAPRKLGVAVETHNIEIFVKKAEIF